METTTDRIIRTKELVHLTGRSRTSIWRDELEGLFPQRIRIGRNAVGWRLSEVMTWLATRQEVGAFTAKVMPKSPGRKGGVR